MANAVMQVLADAVLSAVKGTPLTVPSPLYVALLTTLPTDNHGTGLVEVSATGTGYARQSIASSAWSAISQAADTAHDQISNTGQLTWANSGATNFGSIVGGALYTALTGGSLYAAGPLSLVAVISSGMDFILTAGQFVLEL